LHFVLILLLSAVTLTFRNPSQLTSRGTSPHPSWRHRSRTRTITLSSASTREFNSAQKRLLTRTVSTSFKSSGSWPQYALTGDCDQGNCSTSSSIPYWSCWFPTPLQRRGKLPASGTNKGKWQASSQTVNTQDAHSGNTFDSLQFLRCHFEGRDAAGVFELAAA